MALLRVSALLVAVVATSSCYSYRVASPEQVTPGQDVRVRISAAEAVRLGELVGRDDRVLDGQLLENGNGQVVLGVSSVSPMTATTAVQDPTGRMFQRIAVPRDALLELEVRRLDRTRTGIVVGLLAAATAAVTITQFNHQSAVNEKGKGGGQVVRIPWSLPLVPGR